MKITRLFFIISILLTCACSSTGKRAEKYPPKFYNYPIAEQNLIRQGKIAVGFDAVELKAVDQHRRQRFCCICRGSGFRAETVYRGFVHTWVRVFGYPEIVAVRQGTGFQAYL